MPDEQSNPEKMEQGAGDRKGESLVDERGEEHTPEIGKKGDDHAENMKERGGQAGEREAEDDE